MTSPWANNDPAYVYEYPYYHPAQTVVIPPTPGGPPRKSRKGWIIAAIAVLVLLVGGVGTTLFVKSQTVSMEQQIHDWRAKVGPDFRATAVTMNMIGDAAANRDFPSVTSGCVILQHEIKGLREYLPTPDAKLTEEVTAALDDYDNAAVTCQNMDSAADVNTVVRYMESGNAHVQIAGKILDDADAKLDKEG